MALVSLSVDDSMVQMKHPEFDPYSASGALVIALVDELLSAGQPVSISVD